MLHQVRSIQRVLQQLSSHRTPTVRRCNLLQQLQAHQSIKQSLSDVKAKVTLCGDICTGDRASECLDLIKQTRLQGLAYNLKWHMWCTIKRVRCHMLFQQWLIYWHLMNTIHKKFHFILSISRWFMAIHHIERHAMRRNFVSQLFRVAILDI